MLCWMQHCCTEGLRGCGLLVLTHPGRRLADGWPVVGRWRMILASYIAAVELLAETTITIVYCCRPHGSRLLNDHAVQESTRELIRFRIQSTAVFFSTDGGQQTSNLTLPLPGFTRHTRLYTAVVVEVEEQYIYDTIFST